MIPRRSEMEREMEVIGRKNSELIDTPNRFQEDREPDYGPGYDENWYVPLQQPPLSSNL